MTDKPIGKGPTGFPQQQQKGQTIPPKPGTPQATPPQRQQATTGATPGGVSWQSKPATTQPTKPTTGQTFPTKPGTTKPTGK